MEIKIWNNRQVQRHIGLKKYPTWESPNRFEYFEGFRFFGPKIITARPDMDDSFNDFKFAPINVFKKDRHVVALDNSDVIGIFSFSYCHNYYDFYHYFPRFLDVRKDSRNQGVATKLIKRLEEPCFLWDEVLMIPSLGYTDDGELYLRKVIERELTGKHFRIVDGTMTRLADYDRLGEEFNS